MTKRHHMYNITTVSFCRLFVVFYRPTFADLLPDNPAKARPLSVPYTCMSPSAITCKRRGGGGVSNDEGGGWGAIGGG